MLSAFSLRVLGRLSHFQRFAAFSIPLSLHVYLLVVNPWDYYHLEACIIFLGKSPEAAEELVTA